MLAGRLTEAQETPTGGATAGECTSRVYTYDGDNARHDERELLMKREREETASRGSPEFEVRAQLASHRDAMSLVSRICDEGIPVVHRWKYLLVVRPTRIVRATWRPIFAARLLRVQSSE